MIFNHIILILAGSPTFAKGLNLVFFHSSHFSLSCLIPQNWTDYVEGELSSNFNLSSTTLSHFSTLITYGSNYSGPWSGDNNSLQHSFPPHTNSLLLTQFYRVGLQSILQHTCHYTVPGGF